jgi:hypothetical protein
MARQSRALSRGRHWTLERPQRLNSLLKNSSFDFVLKGRGFKPPRNCCNQLRLQPIG